MPGVGAGLGIWRLDDRAVMAALASSGGGTPDPPPPFDTPSNRWHAKKNVFQLVAGTMAATADGDPVGSWLSDGSNATLLAAVADNTTRPTLKLNIINGQPVIRFDGTNDNLSASFTRNQPHTVFIVGKTTGGTTTFLIDGKGSANTPQVINETSASNYDAYAGGAAVASVTIADNTPFIYCAVFNGASSRARLNADTAVTANIGTNNAAGLTVASRQDNANYHTCDIGEIDIYDSALSTTDETTERNLLNAYWAVF